ncbi:hypothetical protein BGZ98_003613 [Dissophora globulifera]|nr:hypothetical protein BGZ98_003613 [Dissophora globulifera]
MYRFAEFSFEDDTQGSDIGRSLLDGDSQDSESDEDCSVGDETTSAEESARNRGFTEAYDYAHRATTIAET